MDGDPFSVIKKDFEELENKIRMPKNFVSLLFFLFLEIVVVPALINSYSVCLVSAQHFVNNLTRMSNLSSYINESANVVSIPLGSKVLGGFAKVTNNITGKSVNYSLVPYRYCSGILTISQEYSYYKYLGYIAVFGVLIEAVLIFYYTDFTPRKSREL